METVQKSCNAGAVRFGKAISMRNLTASALIQGMGGGMKTGKFTSFRSVFKSYQNDERMIMKGCGHWKYKLQYNVSWRTVLVQGLKYLS